MAEQKTEAENSSSAKEEDEEKSSSQDDHEQAKRKPSKSSEDEDGDGSNDPNPNVGHPPQPDSTTGSVETKSTDGKYFYFNLTFWKSKKVQQKKTHDIK